MDVDEIANYLQAGRRSLICVYRETLPQLDLLVQSIYLTGKPEGCVLSVEFDPIDMVDQGEGWVWKSDRQELSSMLRLLGESLSVPAEQWENVTKSGRLQDFEGELDADRYSQQEAIFKSEGCGRNYLPRGFNWSE